LAASAFERKRKRPNRLRRFLLAEKEKQKEKPVGAAGIAHVCEISEKTA